MKGRYKQKDKLVKDNAPSLTFAELISGKTTKKIKQARGKAKAMAKAASIKALNPPTDEE